MIAISTKPVRECAGCELNTGRKCAVFEHPVMKWKHRQCEGYNNRELMDQYQRGQHPDGAHARKLERAQSAKLAHTVVHSDGVHPLGTRAAR
jgi:hypothetical protein